jgi:transcriptional regulator GlxA family with amidase domain
MSGASPLGQKESFLKWLKDCSDKNITVASICNGAFALGHGGY